VDMSARADRRARRDRSNPARCASRRRYRARSGACHAAPDDFGDDILSHLFLAYSLPILLFHSSFSYLAISSTVLGLILSSHRPLSHVPPPSSPRRRSPRRHHPRRSVARRRLPPHERLSSVHVMLSLAFSLCMPFFVYYVKHPTFQCRIYGNHCSSRMF
jgi:hypothetical protein